MCEIREYETSIIIIHLQYNYAHISFQKAFRCILISFPRTHL